MTTDIPKARIQLYKIAEKMKAQARETHDDVNSKGAFDKYSDEIITVVNEMMYRNKRYTGAPHRLNGISAPMRDFAKKLAREGMGQADIAVKIGVNRSKVSEILHGEYDQLAYLD